MVCFPCFLIYWEALSVFFFKLTIYASDRICTHRLFLKAVGFLIKMAFFLKVAHSHTHHKETHIPYKTWQCPFKEESKSPTQGLQLPDQCSLGAGREGTLLLIQHIGKTPPSNNSFLFFSPPPPTYIFSFGSLNKRSIRARCKTVHHTTQHSSSNSGHLNPLLITIKC